MFFASIKHCRSISWMTPAVPGQSATGRVAAALLMSFSQTSPAPRAASNWSGETGRRLRLVSLDFQLWNYERCKVFFLMHQWLFFFLSDTCHLLTVPVTTSWWQPCWTEPPSWMQPSCLSVSLRFLHSHQQETNLDLICVCVIYSIWFLFCLPAGNESCPQPQTSEHLAAIEIMKLKHILILQNKIDLVKESQAKEQYEQILAFVQGEWAWTHSLKNRIHQGFYTRKQLPSVKPCVLEVFWADSCAFFTFSPLQTLQVAFVCLWMFDLMLCVMFLLQAQSQRALPSFPSRHSWSTTLRWFASTSSKRSQCPSETSSPSPDSSVRKKENTHRLLLFFYRLLFCFARF